MTSWRKHDSNIDPFNAGEPDMPWKGPGTRDDSESTGATRRGRTKRPDAHDAPNPIDDASAQPFAENPDPIQDAPTQTDADERPREKRRSTPRATQAKRVAKARRQAEKASAPGCLPRVILLFILTFTGVQLLSSCVSSFIFTWMPESEYVEELPNEESSSEEEFVYEEEPDVDEYAVLGIVSRRLDSLRDGDPELEQRIATSLEEDIEHYTQFSIDELGIDTTRIATWMLKNVTYSPSTAYVSQEEGRATAYLYTYAPRAYDIAHVITTDALDYLADRDPSTEPKLSDDERADIAVLIEESFAELDTDRSYYAAFKLTYDADTQLWEIDEEEFLKQMGLAFGL